LNVVDSEALFHVLYVLERILSYPELVEGQAL